MEAEDEEDVFLGPAARLVDAVLQFGGYGGNASAMSPAHAAHYREWRHLIEQHMREFERDNEVSMTKAEIEANEKRVGAHMGVISDLVLRIFAVPARTWGDVMLYAQAFAWQYWPGVDPEAEARSQMEGGPMNEIEDDDLARLLSAIFTAAGVGQFAEVRHG
jgi:hypothetical protein